MLVCLSVPQTQTCIYIYTVHTTKSKEEKEEEKGKNNKNKKRRREKRSGVGGEKKQSKTTAGCIVTHSGVFNQDVYTIGIQRNIIYF